MSDIAICITTYVVTIIISFFVAGLIQVMVWMISRSTKDVMIDTIAITAGEVSASSSDETAVASAIAIAKNQ